MATKKKAKKAKKKTKKKAKKAKKAKKRKRQFTIFFKEERFSIYWGAFFFTLLFALKPLLHSQF